MSPERSTYRECRACPSVLQRPRSNEDPVTNRQSSSRIIPARPVFLTGPVAGILRTGPGSSPTLLPHSNAGATMDCCAPRLAEVAQLVEQWTENPCVGSSSLPLGTIRLNRKKRSASRHPELAIFCFDNDIDNNWLQKRCYLRSLWIDATSMANRCSVKNFWSFPTTRILFLDDCQHRT